MQSENQDYGGKDPDPEQGQGQDTPTKPIKATFGRGAGERTDGITKMKGSVTFATDGVVSISVDVTEGSTSNTSSFEATGWAGTKPNPAPANSSATRSGNNVTASNLPKATANVEYTVDVSYVLNNVRKHLEGTVAASHVVLGQTRNNVSLAP